MVFLKTVILLSTAMAEIRASTASVFALVPIQKPGSLDYANWVSLKANSGAIVQCMYYALMQNLVFILGQR